MTFSARPGVHGPRAIAIFAALSMLLAMIPTFFSQLPAHGIAASPESPVANPDLGLACGLDILLILDETGSMDNDEASLEDAYRSFILALENSGTRIGVVDFSARNPNGNGGEADRISDSPDDTDTNHSGNTIEFATTGYIPTSTVNVTPGGVLRNYVDASPDGYEPAGYTNWQEALWGADVFEATYGDADLVVFFTDGDPNTVDAATPGFAGTNGELDDSQAEMNTAASWAVEYSNDLKDNGTHILGLGLGLGGGNSTTRLASVTGPNGATNAAEFNAATTDYVTFSNGAEIGTAFRTLANALCNTTINITKWVPANPDYDPTLVDVTNFEKATDGWDFNATLSDNGGYTWVSGKTPPGNTGGNGEVQFQYNLDNRGGTSDVTITETSKNGYELLGGNCVITPLGGNAGAPTTFATNGWSINDLPDRATVDCDVYNRASFLTLEKKVVNDDGGKADPGDFTLAADGSGTAFDFSGNSGTAAATSVVIAGDYTLSETQLAHYAQVGAWTCEGFNVSGGDTVSVPIGASVLCQVTNDDIEPTLTLVKSVNNSNGGNAKPEDWTLTATLRAGGKALEGISGVTGSIDGGTYDLTESNGPAGYDLVGWGCDNGDDDGTVTLASGDNVTCTATNASRAASLTITKIVADNAFGATASASDWLLEADGPGANDLSGQGAASSSTLPAGDYVLSESGGPNGWEPDDGWSCSNNDNDGTVTLGIGDVVTCTITNSPIQPTITLHKDVQSGNGGNATFEDFTLTASHQNGQFSISGANDLGDNGDGSVIDAAVLVGTYTLSETPDVPGYTAADSWICLADDGVFDGTDTVTLAPGQHADCTIVNTENPANLTVRKTVVNNFGGQLPVNAFTLMVDQAEVTHDVSFPVASNTTYQIWEDLSEVSGYAQDGAVSCLIGDGDPFDLVNGSLVLAEGQSATCTITNNDLPGSITVVKETLPVGSELDFGLFVAEGDGPPLDVDSGQTIVDLPAATYTVGEAGLEGWEQISLSCEDASGVVETEDGEFDLGLGQNARCTIVNGELPTIAITKEIANGDPEATFEFAGAIEAVLGDGESASATVEPGTYQVLETLEDPWLLNSLICEGGAEGDVESATASYDVDYGEHQMCTFVNVERIPDPGTVRIVKNAVGGGPGATFEFIGDLSGNIGNGGTIELTVPVGETVSSTESLLEGWSLVGIACVVESGTGDVNEDLVNRTATATITSEASVITCTFTNEIQPEVLASVLVTVEGACVLTDAKGSGEITVTVSVDNGATVAIKSGATTIDTLSVDGVVEVAEGQTYSWEATPNAGFEFPGGFVSSGLIEIETCTEVLPFTGIFADEMLFLATILTIGGALVLIATRKRGRHEA